jgi:hypothetical protein
MKGRTTFAIAHRLSTIRNATRSWFWKRIIIERGTVDQLWHAKGATSMYTRGPHRSQLLHQSGRPTGARSQDPPPQAEVDPLRILRPNQ